MKYIIFVFKFLFVSFIVLLFFALLNEQYFVDKYQKYIDQKQKTIAKNDIENYLKANFQDNSLYVYSINKNTIFSHTALIKSHNNIAFGFEITNDLTGITSTYNTKLVYESIEPSLNKCFNKIPFDKIKQNNISRNGFRFNNEEGKIHIVFTHTAYNTKYTPDYFKKYIKTVLGSIQAQGYKFDQYDFEFDNVYYTYENNNTIKHKEQYSFNKVVDDSLTNQVYKNLY